MSANVTVAIDNLTNSLTASFTSMIEIGVWLGLGAIAVALTLAMFTSKQSMLGFACAMFWAIFGAYSYSLSIGAWGDIYFYTAFASMFGMVAFTALAAFGLREKLDAIGEQEVEQGDGELIGEKPEKNNPTARERIRERRIKRRDTL